MKLTDKVIAQLVTDRTREGVAQLVRWDDNPRGFGVVVGKTSATFVVQARVDGVKRRKAIAIAGQKRSDGHVWNVTLAKIAARIELGKMADGVNPNQDKPTRTANGPTLRDGYEAHLDRMRKRKRAERTITTFVTEMARHLSDQMDAAINDVDCVALHARLKSQAKARARTNPANDVGAPLANRVVSHVSACWNSLNRQLKGALGTWNPAKSVERDVLQPKRERISDEDLPGWSARVKTMRSKVQQDGLMLALYTGLRSEDVRSIRFDHVDWKSRTLTLPDPKGGTGAAFEIPLSKTAFAILKRRQSDNVEDIGGPHNGWAFPTADGQAITDLRQQLHNVHTHERFPVEDVHTLRRTWESIGHEAGVSDLDLHVLSNHTFSSRNVHESYIAQHMDHLATCAQKIDAAITAKLTKRRSRR